MENKMSAREVVISYYYSKLCLHCRDAFCSYPFIIKDCDTYKAEFHWWTWRLIFAAYKCHSVINMVGSPIPKPPIPKSTGPLVLKWG